MRMKVGFNGVTVVSDGGTRVLDDDDPVAVLSCLRAYVEFEEGLTVAGLFDALDPWSVVLSEAGWLDFDAWKRALDAFPDEALAAEEEASPERIASVVIHPVLGVSRRKGEIGLDVSWQASGRLAAPVDGDDVRSLSFMHPSLLGRLPVVLSTRMAVRDLRGDAPWNEPPVLSLPSGTALVAEPNFYDAVVLGFLDEVSYWGSPSEAEATYAEVMERKEEAVQAWRKEGASD